MVLQYLAHELSDLTNFSSEITIRKKTRQIDVVLHYLAHEWSDLTNFEFDTFFKGEKGVKRGAKSNDWIKFLLSNSFLLFAKCMVSRYC